MGKLGALALFLALVFTAFHMPAQYIPPAGGGSGGGTTITNGSITSLPGTPATGQVYFPTDSLYSFLQYGGASWTYFQAGHSVTPPSGGYAWTNQNGASVAKQSNGYWTFDFPAHSATDSVSIYDIASPVVPFTRTFNITLTNASQANQPGLGPEIRESGSGKLITAVFIADPSDALCGGAKAPCWAVEAWNSPTSFNSTLGRSPGLYGNSLGQITISVASGTTGNITISWSPDNGLTVVQLYQAAKNSFFGTGPDSLGVCGNINSALSTADAYLTLLGVS